MARRSPFAASIQRTLRAMTRAARAGVKAAVKTHKPVMPTPPRAARPLPRWIDGMAPSAGGMRRYRLFKPPGAQRTSNLPLFVLLHGCRQDAAAIARSTRIHALAAHEGFIVLCPEQDHLANPQGCWNWFEMRSGRAAAEAASIIEAIDQACALHGADPGRVVVAGLSAGASMAALLGAHYPERFKAVAMHSGVAPGTAQSAATALRAMQGRGRLRALPTTATLPPLLVIQGSADHVVVPRNGLAAAQWWSDTVMAQAGVSRVVKRGARRAARLTDFRAGTRTVATLCEVEGLGHAWSGGAAGQPYSDAKGPDAIRMIWAFAARAFTPRG
jgi:poly(hydroxyalkanoate) depolymerase family esterase